MKKLKLLLVVIFMVAAIISCDKRNVELRIESIPEYEGTAILIPQEGNTSCEDLAGKYVFSSGRINFDGESFNFSDANTEDWLEGIDLNTGWPNGLTVTVSDGRYISFNYTSERYCVGAVIVKGGPSSNIYTYDPGVKTDANLSAPILINASGLPAGLSNLTFCFVECKEEEKLIIAVKSFVFTPGSVPLETDVAWKWGVSMGSPAFPGNTDWCSYLGYYIYPGPSFPIISRDGLTLANVTYNDDQIIVTATEGYILDRTSIYIGTLDGLQNGGYCPDYTNPLIWMINTVNGVSQSFPTL